MILKRSIVLYPGLYMFEFTDDAIVVSQGYRPPPRSDNWVDVNGKCYLEGTSPGDVVVVAVDDKE